MNDEQTSPGNFVYPEGKESAFCTPLVLRDDGLKRLIFRGKITNNQQNADLPVFGEFVYQRKSKKAAEWEDPWDDIVSQKISEIDAGTGIKLSLKTEEMQKVICLWHSLKAFYNVEKIPNGRRPLTVFESVGAIDGNVSTELERICKAEGTESVAKLLKIVGGRSDLGQTLEQLERLDVTTLERLNTLSGVVTLKNAVALWEANKDEKNEEFWQTELRKHSFLFSQVFSTPVVVFQNKPYVGGKGVENSGGKYPDYLFKNALTDNTLIVELKTPVTELLGNKYRGVFPPSVELSGAVAQVVRYKDTYLKSFATTAYFSEAKSRALNPQCLIVAGRSDSLTDQLQIESFDLFRNNLKECHVITFDELFEKTSMLIRLLEGTEEAVEEVPF